MEGRLTKLRNYMEENSIDGALFTSYQCINYYSDYKYMSFGRPTGLVVTPEKVVIISALVTYGLPDRRNHVGETVIYTDWQKGNFWRAVHQELGQIKGTVGCEMDHIPANNLTELRVTLPDSQIIDIAEPCMNLRLIKSQEEIALMREGARIADLGGEYARAAMGVGVPEYEVAQASTTAMVREIAKSYPHGGVTRHYYMALERTLFLDHASDDNIRYWELNCEVHHRGMELIRPGAKCKDITRELNEIYLKHNVLQYRTFGYGHLFGCMSHYYGREAAVEFREDVDTVLEPNMVVSMEPMITIPEGQPGAGGYREHNMLIVTDSGAENITYFPFGPEHNIVKC